MESQFNVVFTGELKPGIERENFIKAFSQRFQCDEAKAAEVLDAGGEVTMKRAVTKEVAEQFRNVLEELGMTIALAPVSTDNAAADSTNPYAAPKADLTTHQGTGIMSGPVSVPFGHGTSWIGEAFNNHFKANVGAWIGSILVFIVIMIIAQVIPLLGPIAFMLFLPVFTAGFMIGCHAQAQGDDFSLSHLFSGFKNSTGQLILVGLLYFVGYFAIMMTVMALMGGAMSMTGALGGQDPAMTQAMSQNPSVILLPILVSMALTIPLMMAYWFAPALVALEGISALAAMKMSFSGCLKNMLPFLLYGIVMLVLYIIALIPIGLGLLVFVPVAMASMYTSYRDIFYPET